MTTLRIETLAMPSAELGDTNPLPPIIGADDLHRDIDGTGLDADMQRGLAYGGMRTLLPYLTQDGYGRALRPREHPVAVLENELVRAVFLVGLGGRLWSLVDKRTGRELLHSNPVFQPGNLGLRNAWFAGGVEWNIGTTGHWPLTCAHLHTVRVERADGEVALRMYEYERMRGLIVRIDASLHDALLTVRITLTNPRETDVPVYWWSNIAVPEANDVRVVAPATAAWQFDYTGGIRRREFPEIDGIDRSYTTRSGAAADYFFDLQGVRMPWITALDAEGRGLFQASTRQLTGRKLFLWGTSTGGAHWQDWLGDGDGRYLEIQAGLARTQLEHLPLPAGGEWSWTEAYGLAEADAAAIHGDAWAAAIDAAGAAIDTAGAPAVLEREQMRDDSADVVVERLFDASCWGALENARRRASGQPPLGDARTPFVASTADAESEWWALALAGEAPVPDPSVAPVSYQSDPAWLAVLGGRTDWHAHLQRGVILAAAGDLIEAEREWEASIAATDNAWAWRNVAVARASRGDVDAAIDGYRHAVALCPDLLPLAIEFVQFLVGADRAETALEFIRELKTPEREHGRIRLAEARASLATGDIARCGALLDAGIEVADLREGEDSLTALWTHYQQTRLAAEAGTAVTDAIRARVEDEFPPPPLYDFRMQG